MWHTVKKQIEQWRGVLVIAPSVAGLVIAGSMAGFFQLLEWALFDQFVRWRPAESVEQRIVIVTIGETDIKYVRQWPMPDRVMAKLISNINAQQPVGIGIDVYRDLPVEPGHEELVEVFKSTPTAIGVEKVAGNPIAPPPTLAKLEQVGANDLVLDADGKIRRGLIIVGKKDGTFREGFGVKLALMYLEKKGIELESIDADKKIYGLGKATFIPLTGEEGEYNKADMGGYQILLNYRGDLKRFPKISMQDVLENRIPADLMRDRIVLVGATAPSLNDLFQTPLSGTLFGVTELTPGVIVHANLTSQILSAALEDRPMLRTWTKPLNWVWIFFWSGCSATLGSMWLRWRWTAAGIVLAGICITTTSYLALLTGWWIPVFTPLLAVVGSAVVSIGYVLWENLKLSYQQLEEYAQTLEQKVEERTAQLAQANQEIMALNEKLKEENLRMSAELEVTKQLQQMVLPKPSELEAIEGLDIAGFMEPADEVGGDYYDVLHQDGRVKIGIGDVTGHGLESGVLMLMAQTAVRTLQESHQTDPVQFLDILNRTLYGNLQRLDSYKNMTLALIDYADGTLSLSGQHEEMIVVRADGTIECVDTVDLGFPIGLEEEIADFVADHQVELNVGDVVVLYTDGITEAEDLNNEQYGLERLCEAIRDNCQQSAAQIRQAVIDDVRLHIGEQKVFDDITLVVLKQK
ncbi:MAG TPA: transmembrane sensor domain protein [Cyanobacteria bacterium UBA9273]|nr:transmembrane sensor domain protein [Cyanobacteria bacterium UBA9273]